MNYSKLNGIKKAYFGCEEISKALGITSASARVTATRYFKQGILLRIKRNLYILKDRWDALTREGKFGIANLVQVPSYVSLMSALDYYEITTQVQRDFIESIVVRRTKEINVSGTALRFKKINKSLYFGFVKEKDFFIATPEKALLDAVYLMSFNRYNFDLSSIDRGKLDIDKIKAIAGKFPQRTQEALKRYLVEHVCRVQNITKNDNNWLTAQWAAGFMCGEGYFYKQKIKNKYLAFSIGVCMHNRDKIILEALKEKYGGNVLDRKDNKTCQWRVAATKELIKFSKEIAPYLVGYKKEQFIKWFDSLNEYKTGKGQCCRG